MKAEALFGALLPHFQAEVEDFKKTYSRAQLGSFIIPYERVFELAPKAVLPRHCYVCKSVVQWVRVSRSMIRAYCYLHHPKPLNPLVKITKT